MKQFLFLLLLSFSSSSIAQTTYESPHVKDGKTLQLSVPKGFYKLDEMSTLRNTVFCTEKSLNPYSEDMDQLKVGLLTVSYMPSVEETLESMKTQLNEELDSDNAELVVFKTPEITQLNGRKVLRAGFKGHLNDMEVDRMYVSVFEFGDFFVMTYYLSTPSLESPMEYDQFENTCNSWAEIATSKSDEFATSDPIDEFVVMEGEEAEDYEPYFTNDLFETELSYYDILPDFNYQWNDVKDESGHLLSMFRFEQNNGFLRIFSGGSASNYPSEEEMATAVEQAMDWTKPMTLVFNSQFSNEDHVFRLYTISGGGTMSSVYTTEVNEELVFFVVDAGDNPVDNFKPAVRDFMLTMWVDYVEEE